MRSLHKNNVVISGRGTQPILFAHGYGCDQNMWRFVAPHFESSHRVILFDHVGAGRSDTSAYSRNRYETLEGYADDVIDIIRENDLKDVIYVGHSVSGMIGIVAAQKQPGVFSKMILVSPSPSYINEADYTGGFSKEQIDELLLSLSQNHLGWSSAMAPVIMANPERPELATELKNSFCQMDPEIARDFARVTFLSDSRDQLAGIDIPTLILQCDEDVIAPQVVGRYVHEQIRGSEFVLLNATGHCPNLSAPEETTTAIKAFLN